MNLRESAREAPYCFSCMKPNPNGDILCLAHSNELRHGRGAGHKSMDVFGAIVCMECHDKIDGRAGGMSKDEKHEMHRIAHDRTLMFWIDRGYVKIAT